MPYYEFAYNNTVHSTTKYTPFYLVYGRPSKMPSNLVESQPEPLYNPEDYCKRIKATLQISHREVRDRLIEEKTKRIGEINIKSKDFAYKKGDSILIKNETGKKLDLKYNGPYHVLEDMGTNVKVSINNKEDIVHKSRIKHFIE